MSDEPNAELRASAERFRALADSMPQLVWIADSNGVVDYYNARAREYAGIEKMPDGTWRWQPVVHPDDLESTMQAWRQAVAKQASYACEHRVRMADGSYRWHISRAHLVREAQGGKWFGTATDIHAQKLAEEALRLAVVTRDQVVSVVAHDLRNPLTVLRSSLPLLRKLIAAGDTAHAETQLGRMDRQVTKMERLLDELLDLAQLQAGQPLSLDRRRFDLVAMLRELVAEHSRTGGKHQLELRTSSASLEGEWDPNRLERVIENLLSNAVKYSAPGSAVMITAADEGDWVVVSVSDQGMGISEKDRERIFQWYARGANAQGTTRGSGIGLAGARRIVLQHGGTLEVESELGVGSKFVLRLPKVAAF